MGSRAVVSHSVKGIKPPPILPNSPTNTAQKLYQHWSRKYREHRGMV